MYKVAGATVCTRNHVRHRSGLSRRAPVRKRHTQRVWGDSAKPTSCRTRGLRQEPEVSEHVARAKATHPEGV